MIPGRRRKNPRTPAQNVRGFPVLDYDISGDGRQVVMWTTDSEGKSRLWLAPFDHSSPPVQIPNVEGGEPRFGPGGDIVFRHAENSSTAFIRTAQVYGRLAQNLY